MAKTAGSKDVAPLIRGAFKRALLMLDDKRKTDKGEGLSELLLEALEDDVKGTLQAMKGFCPKELDIDLKAEDVTSSNRAELEARLIAEGVDPNDL